MVSQSFPPEPALYVPADFIPGTLYLLFAAYPIVFQVHRGWSEGIGGLAFLGVAVGMFSAILVSLYSHRWYMAAAVKNGGFAPPEARLVIGMIGSISLPIGMFWFAWVSLVTLFSLQSLSLTSNS